MQKDTCVTLGKHFDMFIAQKIKSGRFSSVDETIRAALRLLEEKETKLEALRKALTEGEDSGYANYSLDSLIEELDKEKSDSAGV